MAIPDGFTLAVAQTSSKRGDVAVNVAIHLAVMEKAAFAGADLLIFPELSLTGYELDLAKSLQMSIDDPVLTPLQTFAHTHAMLTTIGLPLKSGHGLPFIGAALLGGETPQSYAKMHVHDS